MAYDKRVKVYSWCRNNKGNKGKESREIILPHFDYEGIRSNLAKRYPWVTYKITENKGTTKKLKFYIQ